MRILFILMSICFICGNCFSDRYIQPVKRDLQEEILVRGKFLIQSNKTNSVTMYHISENTTGYKGVFSFIVTNNTEMPFNFYPANLRVTDQNGRYVKVVSKKELIACRKAQKKWADCSVLFSHICNSVEANKAGDIHYHSKTNNEQHSRVNLRGRGDSVNGTITNRGVSSTTGSVHVEALRQQALRQANQDANCQYNQIQTNYDDWKDCINKFYFDSSTVFPNTTYGANFQVEIPKGIERDLQYLIFTFDVDGEEHTFSYYCGNEIKRWYHVFG